MHSIQATFRNGRLELMQPVDWPDGTRAEVIPLPSSTPTRLQPEADRPTAWPPDYFERTAGALAGEVFERPPQGTLPVREDW
jgi:hypothetical protein